MKRGFLTSEKAKRALEKEYPAKRQAMCPPPRDLAQSTTTSTMALAAATDVHADTHTSVISDHSQRSTTIVPPATVGTTSEGSGGDAVMSSSVEGEADSTVKRYVYAMLLNIYAPFLYGIFRCPMTAAHADPSTAATPHVSRIRIKKPLTPTVSRTLLT
ncbi:hypothetical protein PISMIDRAFT_606586 [Pisolithus microcarpus 441]|uniref:Uncharacterized protein n=1 Tax=Pisolithus microcarpus 441 TaxID=765257 RepID=A0A0D0A156_9AGAM|nr:hypothetical protein PISMIDRAFT_606586 [Pisolithus microcarpus 441]